MIPCNVELLQKQFSSLIKRNLEEKEIFMLDTIYKKHNKSSVFTNVVTGEKKLINNRLIFVCIGTNGLAAGNTFKEAFNQGMSELCERNVMSAYVSNKFNEYYLIDNKSIKNSKLKNIINNFENDNKKIYILDCSYYYRTPVACVMMLDKLANRFQFSFGSFPVFDIAVERCLTEISQNISFSDEYYPEKCEFPFKLFVDDMWSVKKCFRQTTNHFVVDEQLISKCIKKENPSEIFLENGNNDSIFEY